MSTQELGNHFSYCLLLLYFSIMELQENQLKCLDVIQDPLAIQTSFIALLVILQRNFVRYLSLKLLLQIVSCSVFIKGFRMSGQIATRKCWAFQALEVSLPSFNYACKEIYPCWRIASLPGWGRKKPPLREGFTSHGLFCVDAEYCSFLERGLFAVILCTFMAPCRNH